MLCFSDSDIKASPGEGLEPHDPGGIYELAKNIETISENQQLPTGEHFINWGLIFLMACSHNNNEIIDPLTSAVRIFAVSVTTALDLK